MTAINARNRNLRSSDTTELSGLQVSVSEEPRREEVLMREKRFAPFLSASLPVLTKVAIKSSHLFMF